MSCVVCSRIVATASVVTSLGSHGHVHGHHSGQSASSSAGQPDTPPSMASSGLVFPSQPLHVIKLEPQSAYSYCGYSTSDGLMSASSQLQPPIGFHGHHGQKSAGHSPQSIQGMHGMGGSPGHQSSSSPNHQGHPPPHKRPRRLTSSRTVQSTGNTDDENEGMASGGYCDHSPVNVIHGGGHSWSGSELGAKVKSEGGQGSYHLPTSPVGSPHQAAQSKASQRDSGMCVCLKKN